MKKDKLFYTLMKSYIFFALTMGIVNVLFLIILIRPISGSIDITLDWLLLFILLFGLNVWGYSLWMAGRITKPLEKIADGVQQMAEGRYQQRLDFEAGYEFGVIQRHFNEMAANLERTEEENRRLESGRQQMLVDISHDLKTPITTIQGYAKALQLGLVDNEEQKDRYLRLIYNKAVLVSDLIEDIFSLSTLESPEYPLSATSGDLAELIREIAAEYYDQFEDKGFNLELNIPSGEVPVRCDFKLMRRAVSNLVSNALQHNSSGTKVSISVEETSDKAIVHIIDDGAGIPDALKEMVFEPFVRGDVSRRSDGGTGLGLAIAKKTAELHGGGLELDNRGGLTAFQLVLNKD